MNDTILVRLWEHAGTGLIVPRRTGIRYTNQVGGNACQHPELEGFFVPFGNDTSLDGQLLSLENRLFEYFEEQAMWDMPLTDEIANDLEKLMSEFEWLPWHRVQIDRDRLHESMEAWVHVLVDFDDGSGLFPLVEGLSSGPINAVLTWTNTD